MQIFVKSPTGRTICLRVDPSDTLYTVKAKIQQQYHLVFDGMLLEDHLSLSDYGIQHKSTLDVKEKMQIFVVETLEGRTITFEIDNLDTIGDLKSMIEDAEGFPQGQQCLIFGNKQLEDDRTLSDLDICNESTRLLVLHPFPRSMTPRDSMQLLVKMLDGKNVTVEVESSDTIDNIKWKIYEKVGLEPIQQRLIHAGRELVGSLTVADYDIQHGATFYLVVRRGC